MLNKDSWNFLHAHKTFVLKTIYRSFHIGGIQTLKGKPVRQSKFNGISISIKLTDQKNERYKGDWVY